MRAHNSMATMERKQQPPPIAAVEESRSYSCYVCGARFGSYAEARAHAGAAHPRSGAEAPREAAAPVPREVAVPNAASAATSSCDDASHVSGMSREESDRDAVSAPHSSFASRRGAQSPQQPQRRTQRTLQRQPQETHSFRCSACGMRFATYGETAAHAAAVHGGGAAQRQGYGQSSPQPQRRTQQQETVRFPQPQMGTGAYPSMPPPDGYYAPQGALSGEQQFYGGQSGRMPPPPQQHQRYPSINSSAAYSTGSAASYQSYPPSQMQQRQPSAASAATAATVTTVRTHTQTITHLDGSVTVEEESLMSDGSTVSKRTRYPAAPPLPLAVAPPPPIQRQAPRPHLQPAAARAPERPAAPPAAASQGNDEDPYGDIPVADCVWVVPDETGSKGSRR